MSKGKPVEDTKTSYSMGRFQMGEDTKEINRGLMHDAWQRLDGHEIRVDIVKVISQRYGITLEESAKAELRSEEEAIKMKQEDGRKAKMECIKQEQSEASMSSLGLPTGSGLPEGGVWQIHGESSEDEDLPEFVSGRS